MISTISQDTIKDRLIIGKPLILTDNGRISWFHDSGVISYRQEGKAGKAVISGSNMADRHIIPVMGDRG
jgi:hypothetical protein